MQITIRYCHRISGRTLSLFDPLFCKDASKGISPTNFSKKFSSSDRSNLSYLKNPGSRPLREISIGQLFDETVEKWPHRECIVSTHQNVRLTFLETQRRADKLAAGFKKIGLNKGDRLAIWAPNDFQWFTTFMAATRCGLIVAGVNPAYLLNELTYCIDKIEAKAIVAPESFKNLKYAEMLLEAKKSCKNLQHIFIYASEHIPGTTRLEDLECLANKKDVESIKHKQAEISPYDGCNIQFTSGTTGKSKAALLAHRSFVNNSLQTTTRGEFNDGQVHKICFNVPFFHAFGMVMGVVGSLHYGTTIVLENRSFNPVKSIETIIKEKCSILFGTPTMWTNMLDVQSKTNAKIETVKVGIIGGAPASPDLYDRIFSKLKVQKMKTIYGLTETTASVTQSLPGEDVELTKTTVGHISDHIEVKVVNEDNNLVPFGQPGEVCVRGYSIMMGYWDDEENTKKSISDDGWFRTGDQFILNKNGYGLIVGRIKDVIIRGGENIFPKEIEHLLETHPSIVEAHVIGAFDEVYGEEICACIRVEHGKSLKKDDVISYVKNKVAAFKVPRYVVFTEEFPKTTSGKIQKFKLKEQLEYEKCIPRKNV